MLKYSWLVLCQDSNIFSPGLLFNDQNDSKIVLLIFSFFTIFRRRWFKFSYLNVSLLWNISFINLLNLYLYFSSETIFFVFFVAAIIDLILLNAMMIDFLVRLDETQQPMKRRLAASTRSFYRSFQTKHIFQKVSKSCRKSLCF